MRTLIFLYTKNTIYYTGIEVKLKPYKSTRKEHVIDVQTEISVFFLKFWLHFTEIQSLYDIHLLNLPCAKLQFRVGCSQTR